jgi:arsenite methyltransferase
VDGRSSLSVAALAVLVLGGGCAELKRFAYQGIGRDRWQQPEAVVAALEIAPGARVADLGAGGGDFTFRLADAVGPDGRVYAVDTDPDMIAYLRDRVVREGRGNVEVVRAAADDPGLPAPVDLVFTCNTYHHLTDRTAYFTRLARHLRPDGRVAIVEQDGRGWFARLFGHATPPEQIRAEMTAAGYRLERAPDFLPTQSFLVFARQDG